MLAAMLVEFPVDALLLPLVAVTTPDLIRAALACRRIHRLLFQEGHEEGGIVEALKVLAQSAAIQAMHCPQGAASDRGGHMIHLHSLGLPFRTCSEYCATMRRVALHERIYFRLPSEVAAVLAAHERLSAAEPAVRAKSKACKPGPVGGRGSPVLAVGPPVGSLLSTGQIRAIVTFSFEAAGAAGLAQSLWRWVEVPIKRRSASDLQHVPAPPSLHLGVQLQAEVGPGRCSRPELRCAVKSPTAAWIFLQAISATPGMDFELGLAAGGFEAYGTGEDGWYFPREECSWRSTEGGRAGRADEDGSDVEGPRGTHHSTAATIRVLVCVHSALHMDGWSR